MSTPITDAAIVRVLDAEATRMAGSQVEAVHKLYVSPLVARRLELDRAALMDALCEIHIVSHACSIEGAMALKALNSARANFP